MTALDNFLFLAAYTSRSQAYAQALRRTGLAPGNVLLFGNPSDDQPREVSCDDSARKELGLFLPDLTETLETTCQKANWAVENIRQGDVNHPEIIERVKSIGPEYVIYSGYGAQLVKSDFLDLGIPFFHMHSGWLPEYAGSTTLYYSWLQEGYIAVTAFVLAPEIDNGPLIARHRYPLPQPGIDVDHLYDGTIRADMLVRVLERFTAEGVFPSVPRDGNYQTYHVIHPVLKHLALLSLETNQ